MDQGFNEGDRVYVIGPRYIRPDVVRRVTSTQAVVGEGGHETRYNRRTGREIGGDTWRSTTIYHPKPELDREWANERAKNARRLLAAAADKGDADAIRLAYTKWDALEREARATA